MMHVWKTLKVFVSSTFKDLEKERDQMALVFRTIQDEIFLRRLHLIPYDLRWREQNERDLVQWCLDMVSQTDYFIGILGYRYGWRPPHDYRGQENAEKFSITEMEIRLALEIVPPERRFFCFGEPGQYSVGQLTSEREEDRESLETLKRMLKDRGEKVFVYRSAEEAVSRVHRELDRIIQQDYPPGQKAELESYKLQDALAEIVAEKCRGFVGREKYLERIRDFAKRQDPENVLVVRAVAGTGKSALLAQFYQTWKSHHPEVPVVAHYMSMAGNNRSARGILESLGQQLRSAGRLDEELEILPERLLSQIRSAMQSQTQPLLLLLDGLDESDEDAQELFWLPETLPSCFRVVVTTRPVAVWERIRQRPHVVELELPPLEDQEIREIIAAYQGRHRLDLSSEEQGSLAQRAAGNPLFLKVALEEMARGGLAVGQLATTVDALFSQILQRLCGSCGETAIHDYLGLIAAGRSGLTEAELREIIHEDHPVTATEDFFLLVSGALANFVIPREKMLAFFHPEFERSVKMLLGKGGMRTYHKRLALHFSTRWRFYERALLELPYQLQSAEQYEELLRTLTDISFLESKTSANMLVELRQDFQYALEARAVPFPADISVELAPDVQVDKTLLAMVARILDLDSNFLMRHPQCVFQSLWNQGYWHDAPQAAEHYREGHGAHPPWEAPGPKLYRLAEYWRKCRKGGPWIRAIRPLPDRLNSPLVKIFRGHQDFTTAICFTRDGKRIISGGYDRTLRIWDVSSGECVRVIPGHEDYVSCLDINGEGRLIASGAVDGTIRIWDAQDGHCVVVLQDHKKAVASLHFTPDGKKLISAGKDKTIRVWDCRSWEIVQRLKGHDAMINGVAVANDGKTLASGSWDNTVRLWDLESGECLWSSAGHSGHVRCVAISPDGKKIASGSDDCTVRVWDREGKCLSVLSLDSFVFSVAFSWDGQKIVSGDYGVLSVWDAVSFEPQLTIRGHESSIFNLAVSPDNRHVISCSSDRTIRMWEIHTSGAVLQLQSHGKIINDFHLSEDGSKAISASRDNTLGLWSTETGKLLRVLTGHDQHVRTACFSDHGAKIVSGADDKMVKIWDTDTGACLGQLSGHEKNVTCVFADQDGKWIVSGDRDGVIRLWEMSSGRCLWQTKGHESDVRSLYLAQDGKMLISGGEDRTARLWSIPEGKCENIFSGHQEGVIGVCLSPDGKLAYSTSRDNQFLVWDVSTGECKVFAGTGDLEQWSLPETDRPYVVLSQELETVVLERASHTSCLFFPSVLRHTTSHPKGIVGGYAGVHVYLLQMEK